MKTAAEVCRDFVEYAKDREYAGVEYEDILDDAREIVREALRNGELECYLGEGEKIDTGMTFRRNPILIEIKDSGKQKRSVIIRRFHRIMDKYMRTTTPALYDERDISYGAG